MARIFALGLTIDVQGRVFPTRGIPQGLGGGYGGGS